ncbi:MAG: hypothetical protein A3H32_04910 [Betaproteobacteria bacterium RIFCSPLOWO2_02_FULL_63_19]|nr:MAG: hypothetical protein A3H32_04910 [Betaproteobacteria bacterium RIFCSPLOWO2_02_FULL_63_19]
MNCLDLRRAAMLDPRRLDTEALAHVERCDACRDFLAQALELEAQIEHALRTPVPHGLEARVVRNALESPRFTRRHALAAGLALATAAGVALLWKRNDPLALAGIDFVVFEEAQAIADAKPADVKVLARVVREMGVSLPAQLGEIRYVGTCPFDGLTAHHVLVKTPLGKVTLLLIPSRPLASRAVASAHGFEAAVVPAAVGSVAIIASTPRSIARAETLLKSG